MKTSDFNYPLPYHLIAQTPVEPRDSSRLMVIHRNNGSIEHRRFFEIGEYLRPGDILVANDSRVIPARLLGRRLGSGGKIEALLLRRLGDCLWETLIHPGRKVATGTKIEFPNGALAPVLAEVIAKTEAGTVIVHFSSEEKLAEIGKVPLPPYIRQPLKDSERYQTVFSRSPGSVAAPTAGLHFTPELMERLREKGIEFTFITLHVGWDSFRPVRVDDPKEHTMHREYGEVDLGTAQRLSLAKRQGGRIIAVGTTTTRLLETAACFPGSSFRGWTALFIMPGHQFKMVDGLITNFHLPRSTLLMLVSAFAGQALIRRAYREAVALGYRFYSLGDAMMIL